MYQIIFIDIDGTLLSSNNTISPDNIIAIKKAKEKGIKICLSTGRNYISSKKIATHVQADYLISSDGFSIYDIKNSKCLSTIWNRLYFCFLIILCLDYKISKGNAIKSLCKYLNIPIENSISIGNGTNDISMTKITGIGACTSNSNIRLKDIANYICHNTNDTSAVAEVINKFLL